MPKTLRDVFLIIINFITMRISYISVKLSAGIHAAINGVRNKIIEPYATRVA
jgi:hypothetical protein